MNEIWMTAARYRSQLPTIARPRANGDPEDAGGEGNQERTVATLAAGRRQVTTDPLPRRTIRTSRRPSSSSISRTAAPPPAHSR
jgi:hypothetical protein